MTDSFRENDLLFRYGGEFGQRCLLARRLVERGVRFVEVLHNLNFINGTGWDTHNEGQLNQHLLIHELDAALASLVDDLEEIIGNELGARYNIHIDVIQEGEVVEEEPGRGSVP